jgi:phosphate transport system permease protein
VPLAILAAIYTSEFLHPRIKTSVKSTIEIMASLPSVVLGFLAALVIAPFVQGVVPSVIASFATIPFSLLLGAYLWQMLPQHLFLRLGGGVRFLVIAAFALPFGLWLGAQVGPWMERTLFAGDFAEWLDRKRGDGVGGWVLVLLPLFALVGMFVMARFVSPWLRTVSCTWSRGACAGADLGRFLAGVLVSLGLLWGFAHALNAMGLDPRGSVIDTYVQRNALVVGFVMGFAIIPIIYTLAEDALTSVPRHLREASLGAGATGWQTATRIVVPTAMSGLFSAVMIGLGRAVGETMIVLMAAGNTPVMDWNVFTGFRTLSANIATELPEAVRDSTHYRTLFLAALTLFAMTFVLNTIAESVRQRFRKRAFQL